MILNHICTKQAAVKKTGPKKCSDLGQSLSCSEGRSRHPRYEDTCWVSSAGVGAAFLDLGLYAPAWQSKSKAASQGMFPCCP